MLAALGSCGDDGDSIDITGDAGATANLDTACPRRTHSCRDIVNPQGLALEATFREYKESVVANASPQDGFSSCQGCHMRAKAYDEVAAEVVPGVGSRKVHWHLFAAVDVPLTSDMPHQDVLRTSSAPMVRRRICSGKPPRS